MACKINEAYSVYYTVHGMVTVPLPSKEKCYCRVCRAVLLPSIGQCCRICGGVPLPGNGQRSLLGHTTPVLFQALWGQPCLYAYVPMDRAH